MSKYDYVMFETKDPYQLPIKYLSLLDIEMLTLKTKNNIHKCFKNNNNIIKNGNYSIERFKKEVE